jgi:S1-C subfamily serine protease
MNRYAGVLLCVVASAWMLRESTRGSHDDCPACHQSSSEQLSANADPVTVDSMDVDDAALLKRLADEGGSLIEQGRTVEAPVLIKELETDKCDLAISTQTPQAQDPATLFGTAKESVVVVAALFKCARCDNWHAAPASGFVISADGAIVTSHHVIDSPDKKTFVVRTTDGHVYPVVRVLAASRADDLAIIKVDAQGLKPLPLGTDPPIGASVSVISHPAARFYSFSSGVVSRYTKVRIANQPVDALQITADFARGSSGAPVLNAHGQVVGVVRSTESVYYSVESGQQKNLQMVFKICMPTKSLRKLVGM